MDATVKKLHERRDLLLVLVVTSRHIEYCGRGELNIK